MEVLRKYHARDFPNVFAVDASMDDFTDAKEVSEGAAFDLELEMIASLLAVYQRTDKKELLKMFKGELGAEEAEGEAPKAPVKAGKRSE